MEKWRGPLIICTSCLKTVQSVLKNSYIKQFLAFYIFNTNKSELNIHKFKSKNTQEYQMVSYRSCWNMIRVVLGYQVVP